MRSTHGGPTVAVLAAFGLGVEALGLAAGPTVAVAVTVLVGVVALLTVLRVSLEIVGVGAAVGAAFFTSWNGFHFGPGRPGDLLLFVSLGCLLVSDSRSRLPRIPWWAVQTGIAILAVAVLHVLFPTDQDYLDSRQVLGADGRPYVEFQTNFGVTVKFIVGVVILPLVFVLTTQQRRRTPYWLAAAYALGTGLSGLVAFSDGRGVTHLGQTVTGVYFPLGREGGFTDHANFLATACVLGIPLAIWMITERATWWRIGGWSALIGLVLGVYASGSRGGTVGAVVAVAVTLAVSPRVRPQLPTIAFFLGLFAGTAFVASPSLGQALLRATRLGGGTTETSGSDYVRSLVGHQGILDFHHSPIDGVGLEVAAQAQNVYIQELAAGGVILFGAMLVFVLGSLYETFRLFEVDALAQAVFASIVSSVALNFAEASLTDRYYYAPAGVAAALACLHRRAAAPEPEDIATLLSCRATVSGLAHDSELFASRYHWESLGVSGAVHGTSRA